MDQTSYDPYDLPKRIYSKKGAESVTEKDMNTSVDRITIYLAVCTDGNKLHLMVVFKWQPDIYVWREMQQYPRNALYQVQKNAWCDKSCMLYWVENNLKPFVKKSPQGMVPYLLLDKYKCPYQDSVAKTIEDFRMEWNIIAEG